MEGNLNSSPRIQKWSAKGQTWWEENYAQEQKTGPNIYKTLYFEGELKKLNSQCAWIESFSYKNCMQTMCQITTIQAAIIIKRPINKIDAL